MHQVDKVIKEESQLSNEVAASNTKHLKEHEQHSNKNDGESNDVSKELVVIDEDNKGSGKKYYRVLYL